MTYIKDRFGSAEKRIESIRLLEWSKKCPGTCERLGIEISSAGFSSDDRKTEPLTESSIPS